MAAHLTTEQIQNYQANLLSGEELLAAADHLAACFDCSSAVRSSPHAYFEAGTGVPTHLDYETLEMIANDAADPVTSEIAAVHLDGCGACSDRLNDLRILRRELAAGPAFEPRPVSDGVHGQAKIGIFEWLRSGRFLVPAFGLLLAAIAGVWLWWPEAQVDREDVAAVASEAPAPADPGVNESLPAPEEPPVADERRVAVSVSDGGRSIEIDDEGRVSGLGTAAFDEMVRRALTRKQIAVPADAGVTTENSGVLMSGGSSEVPFALRSPVGSVIESQRPNFGWRRMQGAESYTVELFDESYNSVAKSPPLTAASWTAGRPLPRGRTYVWQVTAKVGEKEVRSPVRPAPEAKFKIIDAKAARQIAEAKRTGSKLVLGLVYAEAGMLAEAERELSALVRANPRSDAARALLAKVKAAR